MKRATATRVIHGFRNGSVEDDRAMRRCRCGGAMYDWGIGICHCPGRRRKTPWVMMWYCAGRGSCGATINEHITAARLTSLRADGRGASDWARLRGGGKGI